MSPLALVLVLTAAVCHAGWNVLAHGVSRIGVPFLWWAAVFATVLWAPVTVFTGGIGTATLVHFVVVVAVSAVLHCAYMMVLQRGYATGRLSTVYATARGTGPTLTVVVAIGVLGERPSVAALVGVAAVLVAVVGIGLVDRRAQGEPGRRGIDPGIVWGALTGVAIAAYTLWDAHAVREWGVAPVAFMVGCTLGEIVVYAPLLRRRTAELMPVLRDHWPRLLAFGILSPASYILVLVAVTMAPVALVAPMREVSVVLVALFGVFVLREGRPLPRLALSALVVGGIVLMAL